MDTTITISAVTTIATVVKRKRRSDRKHVIYKLTLVETAETYIGITVAQGRAIEKSVTERWKRHVQRALNEDRNWKLCTAIRTYGLEKFKREVIEVVRGKAVAHKRERELIAELNPALNTF